MKTYVWILENNKDIPGHQLREGDASKQAEIIVASQQPSARQSLFD